MKKNILMLAAVLCLGTVTLRAQEVPKADTTIQQNYRKDMTKIQASEIPASLKTTLQDAQYKGWEQGTVYKSKNGDMYVVELNDANNRMQTYRFDANGKPIKDN